MKYADSALHILVGWVEECEKRNVHVPARVRNIKHNIYVVALQDRVGELERLLLLNKEFFKTGHTVGYRSLISQSHEENSVKQIRRILERFE